MKIAAKNDNAQTFCELLDAGQLKFIQIYQVEGRPEQSLTGFPQAGGGNEPSVSSVSNNLSPLTLFSFQTLPIHKGCKRVCFWEVTSSMFSKICLAIDHVLLTGTLIIARFKVFF